MWTNPKVFIAYQKFIPMECQILNNTSETTSSNNEIVEYAYAWHYTTGIAFQSIVKSGVLLPSKKYIAKNERPVLWFSLNQDYEPTAAKGVRLDDGRVAQGSRDTTYKFGGGLVRFGYAAKRLIPWRDLKKKARIPIRVVDGLERVGRKMQAHPGDWLGSFRAISISELVIDVWDGASWVRIR
jgi:hypothetical protein